MDIVKYYILIIMALVRYSHSEYVPEIESSSKKISN